jgi:hypothetical protein
MSLGSHLYQGRFLVLIPLKGLVDRRAIVRLEAIPVTGRGGL